jgi:hypothetical protein
MQNISCFIKPGPAALTYLFSDLNLAIIPKQNVDSSTPFAQIILVPGSALSQRAAGLFYLKFFTELDLHADDSIMGKMVWFSHAKAKEILKRRNLPGAIEVRC